MDSKIRCDDTNCIHNKDGKCDLENIHIDHVGFCMSLEELPDEQGKENKEVKENEKNA